MEAASVAVEWIKIDLMAVADEIQETDQIKVMMTESLTADREMIGTIETEIEEMIEKEEDTHQDNKIETTAEMTGVTVETTTSIGLIAP